MLRYLVEISLRQRVVVITLALVLIGWGLYATSRSKLDVLPDFVQPQVVVQTEAPGLAPEQVEALVTRPVETALNGAGNLESIRSESIQGLSVVTAIFKDGTEVYQARQMIAERLAQLGGELPSGIKTPVMEPLTSSTMDLLKFGLTSDKLSPMDLRTFADWMIRPRLLAVLQPYFREEDINLDRNVVENAPDDVLISSLVMICPLAPNEKQALLEAPDLLARAQLLTALLEMACMPGPSEGESGIRH